MSVRDWPTSFRKLLFASAFLRVGLILYSEWHDTRSVVKYTDVDYRVFSDAVRFLFRPSKDNLAQGPLSRALHWDIGSPYSRETYRYTPLLALVLLPNEFVHASFGKYLFAACDLVNGVLIHHSLLATSLPSRQTAANTDAQQPPDVLRKGDANTDDARTDTWATTITATHLLNPLVFSISTRGSSESVLCTLVLLTLYCALRRRWDAAAVLLGISTHWKIYPVVYGVSAVAAIAGGSPTSSWVAFARSLVCVRTIRFTILSAGTFFLLGAFCYAIWGYPFLYNAYLYHADRLDHRHNFSPYFYLTYLTYPGQPDHTSPISLVRRLLRSPLTSLIPQLSLALGTGILLGRRTHDLPFAWFVQTFAFVLFNRVCTSQYFLWYTLFLPLVAPHMRAHFSWRSAVIVGIVWAGTQALWLAEAYKLEFLGQDVFFGLWLRSLLYVGGHAWVLGKVMEEYATTAPVIQ